MQPKFQPTRGPVAERLAVYLARCTEGDGGCLLWPGVLDHGVPAVTLHGRRASLRRLVLEAKLGRKLRPHCVAGAGCGENACINAEHLRELTRAQLGRRAKAHVGMDVRLRIAAAKQAASTKLDWQRAREIRARACAGEPHQAVADAHGISRKMVWLIAAGRAWREVTPWSI